MKTRSLKKLFALLVMLCLFVGGGMIPAQAVGEEKDVGSIEVVTAPFAESTSIGVYRVGACINGRFVLDEPYSEADIDFTAIEESTKLQEAAERLSLIAAKQEPLVIGVTDANGHVTFSDLKADDALYLVCQLDHLETILISPTLLTLPYQDVDGDIIYNMNVTMKWEDVRVIPEKGAIILNKVDLNHKPLAGAEFSFSFKQYADPEDDTEVSFESTETDEKGQYEWVVLAQTLTTDENGQIMIENLPLGTYRLIETKAPKGFKLDSTPLMAEVTTAGSVKKENLKYVPDEGEPVVLNFQNEPEDESVPPPPESSEPSQPSEISVPEPSDSTVTGDSMGKYIVIGVVVGVSLVAVILLIVLGKKNKKDD